MLNNRENVKKILVVNMYDNVLFIRFLLHSYAGAQLGEFQGWGGEAQKRKFQNVLG